MRLKEYIDESVIDEVKNIINIIKPMISLLHRYLKDKDWEIDDKELIEVLNIVFGKGKPKFVFDISKEPYGGYKTVNNADFDISGPIISINIYLTKGASKFFETFKDPKEEKNFTNIRKNEFFSDLISMLSHEFRHLGQLTSSKFKAAFVNPDELTDKTYWKYLESHVEIDAFSFEAAIDYIKNGKNGNAYKIYKQVFDPKDKTYKKFLKKFELYKEKIKKSGLDKIF